MPREVSDQAAGSAVMQVLDAFMAERVPIYIVGGAVRDHLLGLSSIPGLSFPRAARPARAASGDAAPQEFGATTTDLDLVLQAPAMPVARRVADRLGWAFYALDSERDVGRLIGPDAGGKQIMCDAAALRGDLREDLLTRDFTANALALKCSAGEQWQLIDICGGIQDVEARLLRRITPESLDSDPVRLLRAARLSAQLAFAIEKETRDQIVAGAAAVLSVSVERVRDEMWKLLDCARPDAGIDDLRALGLLVHLAPEVGALQGVAQSSPHSFDAYEHTLSTVRYAAELRDWLRGGPFPADEALTGVLARWSEQLRDHFADEVAAGHDRAGWLVWHALFHDTGKPGSRSTLRESSGGLSSFPGHPSLSARIAARRIGQLRFSRKEVLLAEQVAANHNLPRKLYDALPRHGTSCGQRDAYRFYRDVGSVAAGRRPVNPRFTGDHPRVDGLDVTLQAIADYRATRQARGEEWRRFLAVMGSLLAYAFSGPDEGLAKPLVDGRTLMQHLGLAPGPKVGALLRELAEAQAAGELANQEEALALSEALSGRRRK